VAPRKVPQPCERCGVPFTPRRGSRQRFCSRACAARSRSSAFAHGNTLGLKHGLSHTLHYGAWKAMCQRCSNQKNEQFPNYGGRGITVCPRWRDDYMAFLADVGPRPSPLHSLDRIDNDGHYEPGNVRWATIDRQLRNQRRARLITFGEETLCLTDWAHRCGLTSVGLHRRLEAGWSLEKALLTRRKQA
jgi:hypothetical protein